MKVRIEDTIRAFSREEWNAVGNGSLGMRHEHLSFSEELGASYGRIRYGLVVDETTPYAAFVQPEISSITPFKAPAGLQERSINALFRRGILMFDVPRSVETPGVLVRGGVDPREAVERLCPLLTDLARARHRPLLGVVLPEPVMPAWRAEGWAELELPPLTEIRLTGTYEDYLRSMRKDDRRELGRMGRRARDAGVRFGVRREFAEAGPQLHAMLANVYRRHGKSPPFSSNVFASLARHFGPDVVLLTATIDDQLAGYFVSIRSGDSISLPYCGIDYELARKPFVYFLLFEAAVRHALELGVRRIGGGIFNYDQKRSVGFELVRRSCAYRSSSKRLDPLLRRAFQLVQSWGASPAPGSDAPRA